MRHTIPGLAAELGWTEKAFREALQEAFRKPMVKADERNSLIVVPNFIKHNKPESSNVVKSWVNILELLPQCELLNEYLQQVKGLLEGFGEGYDKALPYSFARPSTIPDPELLPDPEQIEDQDPPHNPPVGGARKRSKKTSSLSAEQQVCFDLFWQTYPRGDGKQNAIESWAKGNLGKAELSLILIALRWQVPDWEHKAARSGYSPPHASTYLNQKRWEDKPSVEVKETTHTPVEILDPSNEFIRRCAEMERTHPNMERSDIAERVEMEMAEAEQVRKAAEAKRRGNGELTPIADLVNTALKQGDTP